MVTQIAAKLSNWPGGLRRRALAELPVMPLIVSLRERAHVATTVSQLSAIWTKCESSGDPII